MHGESLLKWKIMGPKCNTLLRILDDIRFENWVLTSAHGESLNPQLGKLNFHMPCDYVSFLCVKKLFKLLSDYSNCHFKLIRVNKTWIPGDSHPEVWLQKRPNWLCVHLRLVQHPLREPAPPLILAAMEASRAVTPSGSPPWTGRPGYVVPYSYLGRNNSPFNNDNEKMYKEPRSLTSKLYNKNTINSMMNAFMQVNGKKYTVLCQVLSGTKHCPGLPLGHIFLKIQISSKQ